MTRTSQKKLHKKTKNYLDREFAKTLRSLGGEKSVSFLLDELLSPTERVMLTKRLAAVLMLARGVSGYRVHKILGISQDTAARIKKDILAGAYPHVRTAPTLKKSKEKFRVDIEKLVRFGMPELGKNRWKWLDEI